MSGLKETQVESHSVPVAPPGTSHSTPYPQPLQPRGWAPFPFPSFSDSFITQPFWLPVILVPGLSLFLSHFPHLSSQGLIQSAGCIQPGLYQRPLQQTLSCTVQRRGHHGLSFPFKQQKRKPEIHVQSEILRNGRTGKERGLWKNEWSFGGRRKEIEHS